MVGAVGKYRILLFLAVLANIACNFPRNAIASPHHKAGEHGTARFRPSHFAAWDQFRGLPATFEPNLGQVPPGVRFLSRTSDFRLSFESRQILIGVPESSSKGRDTISSNKNLFHAPESSSAVSPISLTFPGASRDSQIDGLDVLETKTNYYLGQDPSKWLRNVPNFGRIRYRNLYEDIDLVFHGERGGMEYDFLVAPGADPGKIRIKVQGASRPIRLASGAVEIAMGNGELQFAPPEIFQVRNGKRESIRGRIVRTARNTLGFHITAYDHALPLIIDPVLTYATFLSGSQDTEPVGIAVDSAGEIYVAGTTMATDFPTSAAVQPANGGYENAFLSKISASGTSLVFSTYIGGNAFDTGAALALDSQGNAFLLGNTTSDNFATSTGSFRTACPPSPSCSAPFLSKFGPTGSLIFSTLLSVGAVGKGIAVDKLGNAYITGIIDFPGLDLVNAFEPQYQGQVSSSTGGGFVQELNASGTALVYSTYLAGVPGTDGIVNTIATGIAVDANGSAYVTGTSNPANFPTRNTSLTLNAGHGIFVVKFTPDGSDLVFSASISGSDSDTAAGIALDPQNNIYITGSAGSTDFPVTPGAFQSACSPVGSALCQNSQVFALEVSADGSSLLYSTLIASGYPGGIAVDSNRRAYITGTTAQSNFPTVNPIQATLQSGQSISQDAFVTALDPTGIPFFSTFLGGAATVDAGRAIAVDPAGTKIYVAGTTGNGDFPLVHPGQISSCCSNASFIAAIDVAASLPALSVTPRWDPFLYVRNISSVPLNITAIASSDPTPLAGDCLPAHSLAPGASCNLVAGGGQSYTVEPYFTLTVTSDAPGSPEEFRIYEDTIFSQVRDNPALVTSPTALYFGYQLIGTASAPQNVTLTNLGQAASIINSISSDSSAVTVTNNCPPNLGASESCTIQVVFAPTTQNTFGGTVSISHDRSRIDIGAGGLPMTNAIQASTRSIRFGSQFVGLTYQPRTVVLTNISSTPVVLTSFTSSSGYSQTNNCPNPLPGGGNCRVFVSFDPTANGENQGTLTVTHNSAGGEASVQLDGTGLIRSDLSISPLQLIFPGNTLIGSTFGPQTVTVQNTSTITLTLSSISISPSVFTISPNTCLGPLISGATCALNVSFTPASAGPVSGTLTIVHSGLGNPQIISLGGTGSTQLTLSGEVNFGDQEVGTTGGWHYVSATNLSFSTPVTVSSISVTGDFQIAQGDPGIIPAGYGTAYQLTFTPSATGLRTGTFTLVASDSSTPHQITLTGNGVSGGIGVSPESVAFGDLFAGSTSGAQTVTVVNVSGSPVHFQSVSASGPYAQTNTCGSSLAVGASCTISVTFSPVIVGGAAGQITLQDDAAGSPQVINLSGTGTGTVIKLSPPNVFFDNQVVGSAGAPVTVSLTNRYAAALSISTISTSGDFSESNDCGVALPPGGSCNIEVMFLPTATGLRSGTLSIADNLPNSPQTVGLSGVGTLPPSVSLSSSNLDFGSVLLNQTLPLSITLSAVNAPVKLQGFDMSSPIFREQNECPASIAVGVPCTISVSFQPTSLSHFIGTMVIHDDATNAPQTVQLTGSGTDFTLRPTNGNGQVAPAGQPVLFDFSLISGAASNDTVSFTCSGLPAQTTCSFSPSVATVTGVPQSLRVKVQTTARSSIPPGVPGPHMLIRATWNYGFTLVSILFSLLVLLQIFGLPVKQRRVLPFVVLVGVAMGLLSCGGAGSGTTPTGTPPSQSGTPSGSYTITVTGTSSNSANPAQTIQLSFTVD